ncbi:MAG: signal peptidase II [Oscillospiraceae bacterium]|nr:signal peptidase II [Oscillospiraceae bacterium]
MIQAITLLVIAALVAIDQVIKIAVVNRFAAGGSMDILFGLIRIRYVENTGAAFSSMQNQTVFLTIFTAVVIVMFIFLLMTKKIKPGFIYWCVAVVIAGGAGNFFDRVARGFVVDYIEMDMILSQSIYLFPYFSIYYYLYLFCLHLHFLYSLQWIAL